MSIGIEREKLMDKDIMDGLSMDIAAAEQDKLRAIFPQCFVEGKLDVNYSRNGCYFPHK